MDDAALDLSAYENGDNVVHFVSWSSESAAVNFARSQSFVDRSKINVVRVLRGHGKTNRDEAPKRKMSASPRFPRQFHLVYQLYFG